MPSEKDRLTRILELCCGLERRAHQLYRELAANAPDEAMVTLWQEMAEDEAEHLAYWQRLLEMARKGELPTVFDQPEELEDYLSELPAKIEVLAEMARQNPHPPDVLVLALRLEFYLLDPRFQSLFHCLYDLPENRIPEEDYERHLQRLMTMLRHFEKGSQVMMLLTEAIERLWKVNKEASRHALTDHLTGLHNRRGLQVAMHPLAYLARRNGQHVGMMMLDIDDFKKVNDTLGHPAGDRVLRRVATLLGSRLRSSDILGRYGGEEFLVVMAPVDPHHLTEIAETLRSGVEIATVEDGIKCTISIGVAHAILQSDVEKGLETLLFRADQALLEAKRTGKNRVVVYEPDAGSADLMTYGERPPAL